MLGVIDDFPNTARLRAADSREAMVANGANETSYPGAYVRIPVRFLDESSMHLS